MLSVSSVDFLILLRFWAKDFVAPLLGLFIIGEAEGKGRAGRNPEKWIANKKKLSTMRFAATMEQYCPNSLEFKTRNYIESWQKARG